MSETVVTTEQIELVIQVAIDGLVGWTTVTLPRNSLQETTIHYSELTITPIKTTPETVTVKIELLEANGGKLIQTRNRNGTAHL